MPTQQDLEQLQAEELALCVTVLFHEALKLLKSLTTTSHTGGAGGGAGIVLRFSRVIV